MPADWSALFETARSSDPERLHFAAHSHHLWPDVTCVAQEAAWLDAARGADEKWGPIFGDVIPKAQANVARTLGVSDPTRVVFSANTHDLIVRLLSSTDAWGEGRPMRVLTTGAEFHSVSRQLRRWAESGKVQWTAVPEEPFSSFPERFRAAAREHAWDVVIASHVLFNSGYVFQECFEILSGVPESTVRIVDGYHGFMAVPTDFGPYADQLYYTSGGYKYAMSGEGACFLVAPHGRELRPEITGWFAGFDSLADSQSELVGYDGGAARFYGATFEPTPLYRFNAVCELLDSHGLDVPTVHGHATELQEQFLALVEAGQAGPLAMGELLPDREVAPRGERGRFLCFRRPDAQALQGTLLEKRVVTDARDDRLRFGFGLYQTAEDVDSLGSRLRQL